MTSFSATATTNSRAAAGAAAPAFDATLMANLYAGSVKLASRAPRRPESFLQSSGDGRMRGIQRDRRQCDDGAMRIRGATRARNRQPGLRIVGVQIEGVFAGIELEHRAGEFIGVIGQFERRSGGTGRCEAGAAAPAFKLAYHSNEFAGSMLEFIG